MTPFGQSKPPIYLRRARRESLPARWPARARDGLVSANRVNLLERYDYPDVGVAMGTGTYVAMNSSQVTLVKGDLRGIAQARTILYEKAANMKQILARLGPWSTTLWASAGRR